MELENLSEERAAYCNEKTAWNIHVCDTILEGIIALIVFIRLMMNLWADASDTRALWTIAFSLSALGWIIYQGWVASEGRSHRRICWVVLYGPLAVKSWAYLMFHPLARQEASAILASYEEWELLWEVAESQVVGMGDPTEALATEKAAYRKLEARLRGLEETLGIVIPRYRLSFSDGFNWYTDTSRATRIWSRLTSKTC